MGKTIFISSHILSELALLCDSVTIVDRGTVRYSGAMSGLHRRDEETADYMLSLVEEHPETEAALRKVGGVIGVTKEPKGPQYRVSFQRKHTDPNTLLRAAMECGAQIQGFQEIVRHLNQAFMDLTEPGVPPIIEAGGNGELSGNGEPAPPPVPAAPGGVS